MSSTGGPLARPRNYFSLDTQIFKLRSSRFQPTSSRHQFRFQ